MTAVPRFPPFEQAGAGIDTQATGLQVGVTEVAVLGQERTDTVLKEVSGVLSSQVLRDQAKEKSGN